MTEQKRMHIMKCNLIGKKNTVFFMAINLLGGSITIQMNANGVGSFFSADPLIIWFGYITINNTILHVGN